jgi:pantoate--beta-alanine ligase
VRIVGVPTVREPSGLALSSRNGYLSEAEKRQAAQLYQSLRAAQAALEAGGRDYAAIEAAQLAFLRDCGFKPDYFSIRRPDLAEPDAGDGEFVILAAAWLGRARLIDNIRAGL